MNKLPSVEERLRKANEYLSTKHGIDPNGRNYKKRKSAVIYAWEHDIDVEDVARHRRGEPITKRLKHSQAIEQKLGRPLKNKRPEIITSRGYAVRNVITGEVYSSMSAVGRIYGMKSCAVQKRIENKKPFDDVFYEYV